MKTIVLILALTTVGMSANAQKYFTKTANVGFYSKASLEDIEGKSNQVTSIIDFATGEVVFKMLIKTFQFEKALMQEHFNDNYMESGKFPEATFSGKVESPNTIDPTKDGEYKVKVSGNLTIHGVTKHYVTDGTITIKGGTVKAKAKFPVRVADHGIKIPGGKMNNIAEVVEVTVDATYAPMNK